jgi:Family of unknown function (DUF5941)
MAAEELAADRRGRSAGVVGDPVARDVARWASSRELAPSAMAAIALGFGVIAAVWLTVAVSLGVELVAFAALVAAFVAGRAGRLMGNGQLTAATDWSLGACAVLTELVVYAGIAGGASLHPANLGLSGPAGSRLRGTFAGSLGGLGTVGVWRLAVAAVITLAVLQMAGICQAARTAAGSAPRAPRFQAFAGVAGGERILLIGAAFLLGGARTTFLLLVALGALVLCVMLTGRPQASTTGAAGAGARPDSHGHAEPSAWLPWCRGDGPLSLWIGRFVDGRLPPLPPLLVGLLVTGMLTWLGLQNLPGILVLTPVEAMLLATLASRHPHDGPRDWLAPPLLQAGEYVFLAAAGFAFHVWPAITFALLAAVMLRHLDLACRAKNQLARGADWRGLGWDGRMIVAGIAAATHILPVIYPMLAVYLWALLAWDWAAGWSTGHAAVNRQRRAGHE